MNISVGGGVQMVPEPFQGQGGTPTPRPPPEFATLLDVNNVFTLEKWDKRILRGLVRRIGPPGRKWLELSSERPAWITLTAIHAPRVASNESLKIRLPILVIMMKQMFKRPFAFQISIVDSAKEVRRFMICTPIHSTFLDENKILWVPLQLEKGWNLVEIDLEDFNFQAFGTHFEYVDRIQIHPNCLLKEVYFQSRNQNRGLLLGQMQNMKMQQMMMENVGAAEGPSNEPLQQQQEEKINELQGKPQQFKEQLSPIALLENSGFAEPNLMHAYNYTTSIPPQPQTQTRSPPIPEPLYSREVHTPRRAKTPTPKTNSSPSPALTPRAKRSVADWSKHRKMKSPFPIFSPTPNSGSTFGNSGAIPGNTPAEQSTPPKISQDLAEELKQILLSRGFDLNANPIHELVEGPSPTPPDMNNNVPTAPQPKPEVKRTDSTAFYALIKEKLHEIALKRGASTTSEVEARQLELLGDFLEKQVSQQELDQDWEQEYQQNLASRLTEFFDKEKHIRKTERLNSIKKRIVSGIREKAKICDRQGPSLTLTPSNKRLPVKKKIRRNASVPPPHGFLIPALTPAEYQTQMMMKRGLRRPVSVSAIPASYNSSQSSAGGEVDSMMQKDLPYVKKGTARTPISNEIELHMGGNRVKKLNKSSKIYIGILDTIKRADSVWQDLEKERTKKEKELEEIGRLKGIQTPPNSKSTIAK